MKQSVIIDIGSSKVLAMVVCPAADGAIIVQNAEERTYSGYRFGELPNAAALSDTLESIASAPPSQCLCRSSRTIHKDPAQLLPTAC